jgi:hypothetical protein
MISHLQRYYLCALDLILCREPTQDEEMGDEIEELAQKLADALDVIDELNAQLENQATQITDLTVALESQEQVSK